MTQKNTLNNKTEENSLNRSGRKISYKVSLGGIMASLCLLLMFLTAVFPPLNITLPLFAGMLMTIVAIEVSSSWAFVTYATVAILSFFITPDKEAAIFFAVFFGYYPILKYVIERLKSKVFGWIIKFAVYNAALVVIYQLTVKILGTIDLIEEFGFMKEFMLPGLLVIMNAIFLLYDFCLATIKMSYIKWFRPTFLRKFK